MRERNAAEAEAQALLKVEEDQALIERGSLTLADGTIIEENINVGEQVIDPRTPTGFGNPFIRQLEAASSMLSLFIEDGAKDFWYNMVPLMMNGKMYTLPVGEKLFTARLRRWYQALFQLNMGDIINDFGAGVYQPFCNQTSEVSYKTLYEPQCLSPCQCQWYSTASWRSQCEKSCAGNDIISIYECRWATAARDSIVPLARANNYARHQTSCGLQVDLAYSKKLILSEQKIVSPTAEHPMEMDVAMDMGTF